MGNVAEQFEFTVSRKTWAINRVGNLVSAHFSGKLLLGEAQASAREFVSAVGKDHVDVVFDIREMVGYESSARKEWARVLKPVAQQLRGIEIRGGSALVKMGGSVLGAVLGVPVRFT